MYLIIRNSLILLVVLILSISVASTDAYANYFKAGGIRFSKPIK